MLKSRAIISELKLQRKRNAFRYFISNIHFSYCGMSYLLQARNGECAYGAHACVYNKMCVCVCTSEVQLSMMPSFISVCRSTHLRTLMQARMQELQVRWGVEEVLLFHVIDIQIKSM